MKTDFFCGALPGEWQQAVATFGARDLLPVVSNPDAAISEFSKVKEPCKTPSDYNRNGKMRGLPNWTEKHSTQCEVTAWSKVPDYGIALQTRTFRAIDVDVNDFDEAVDIEAYLAAFLGYQPNARRRPNSSKFLILVHLSGDHTKRRFKTRAGGVIEFLATGQQCIISGTHTSRARYQWDNGFPDHIPEIDPSDFELLWSGLEEHFGNGEASTEKRQGVTLAKRRQIADINDPLVDFLDDRGLLRDIARDGRVDITCPWEHEHTSDTGDSSTSYYPAGVGGFERGHFVCMHAHCTHRTDQDFLNAIGWTVHGFDEIENPPAESAPPELPAFIRSKDGKIEATRNNLALILSRPELTGYGLRFDTFLDALMISDGGVWREFVDEDYFRVSLRLEKGDASFKHIPDAMLRDAIKFTCRENTFDTAEAWLSGLTWDGVSRVETFLSRYVGAVDSPYTRAASRYFWSALAGRVLVPGVKADMALIAVGEQGAKKSTLVHALVPESRFAGELDLSDDRVEIARSMRGKLVMELGELSGFSKRSVEHLKAFISRQKEEWVPKYKEFTTTVHRRCLFFGTTNSEEILVDETGNRRWLPFRSSGADPEALAAIRDQLWAEGAALFRKNGVLWQEAERLARDEHSQFAVTDPWDGAVYEWLYRVPEMPESEAERVEPAKRKFTNSEVLESALHIAVREQTKTLETRMGKILARFGFERVQERIPKAERDRTTGSSKDRRWVYLPKASL